MNYRKVKASQKRPTGKQNCICWLENGVKVACYYHQKKQQFIGRYNGYEGKTLEVSGWCYAILPKRQSHLFAEFVECMTQPNGKYVLQQEIAKMDDDRAQRMFDEVQLLKAAILKYVRENG